MVSYAYTVDDAVECTGFVVREETVLAGTGGIVDLLPEEGEKVARGETVALVYQSEAGLDRKQQIQALTLEREQLQYVLAQSAAGGDTAQLSQQVIGAIVALRSSVAAGDLTGLEEETMSLKSLVYKREYTYGEGDGGGRSGGRHPCRGRADPGPEQSGRPGYRPGERRAGGRVFRPGGWI